MDINNKKNDSLNTLKILLRNKEYIYILCARDLALITFNEDNNDFINKNNDEFYNLIKCFKNFQNFIKYEFIEFGEKLNNITLQENNDQKETLLERCKFCGFKIIKDYYKNHLESNCEFSNRISCFVCFQNFQIKNFIIHRENICFIKCLKDIQVKNENNTKKIQSLKYNVDKNERNIKSNYYEIQKLNSAIYSLENKINNLEKKK